MKTEKTVATNTPIELIGKASQEQIDAWKLSHPSGFYHIKHKGHIAYFREGNRDEVNAALADYDPKASTDMVHTYGESTFIGGSRALLDDAVLFKGCVTPLKNNMEGGEAAEVVNY
jgi:hypothetical protein